MSQTVVVVAVAVTVVVTVAEVVAGAVAIPTDISQRSCSAQ